VPERRKPLLRDESEFSLKYFGVDLSHPAAAEHLQPDLGKLQIGVGNLRHLVDLRQLSVQSIAAVESLGVRHLFVAVILTARDVAEHHLPTCRSFFRHPVM
jgi:hypothetical protein